MNPPIETRKGVTISLWVAAVLFASLCVAGTALATPVTFNLNYGTPGAGTAAGTFTVDSSLLVPDVETHDLANLLCFNLTITVPGVPTQTFTKADLDDWYFRTHPDTGAITAATFGMDPIRRCPGYAFIIIDVDSFQFCAYDCEGPFGSSDPTLGCFEANPVEGGVCEAGGMVPTLSLSGLLVLLLAVGAAAVLILRRGSGLG